MSRAALAVQSFSVNGKDVTFTAPNGNGATNGNTIASTTGRTVLIVNNSSSTLTPTITVKSSGSAVDGIIPADATFTVPAQATLYTIWLHSLYWGGGGGSGNYAVDISLGVGITWAAIDLPTGYQ